MDELLTSWTNNKSEDFDEKAKSKLPEPGQRNILITSALPYVNNVPHLGNIIGCVLSGDAFSRFCRIRGYHALYVCGTDEYGTATEMKALQEGTTPAEICEKYFKLHKQIYEWFNIDFDIFDRTSTKNQTEICQEIFLKLHREGFTSISNLNQLHCPKCDKFLADRYVFGTCPLCGYDDARGDQCDKCAKLLDAVNLINPKCHLCGTTPGVRTSEHIFIDLTKLSNETENYVNSVINLPSSCWSSNAVAIVQSWIKSGLEKRCITRDLQWGTPVPLKGFEKKVFYVWFDAPIGYLSITKTLVGDDWEKWWKNEDVELFQFVGKDNVAFHGIVFPSTQLGTRDPYTMIRHLCATEYLNYENQKFSKSRGVGVFGDEAASTGIPSDIWRFYLLYMRPETHDTMFSWDDFMNKRALTFLFNYFEGTVPEMHIDYEKDSELFIEVNKHLAEYTESMDKVKMRQALLQVLAVSRQGNLYMQVNEPWKLIKSPNEEDKKRAKTVIGVVANLSVLLSVMLYPFMPAASAEIRRQCNIKKPLRLPKHFIQFLPPGWVTIEPKILFENLKADQIAEWKLKFGAADKSPQPVPMTTSVSDQEMISRLLLQAESKFDVLKKIFVQSELAKLNDVKAKLQKEVRALRVQMEECEQAAGVKVFSSDAIKNIEVANKAFKSQQEVATPAPATEAKPEQPKQKEAKPKKTAEKSDAPKKGEKAADSNEIIDVGRLDLRVGRIVHVEKHPDADALYLEQIDVGEEKPRTVISGLVKHVPIEEMRNRLVVCVCNLKPAKMRGIESQAMVLCASTPEKVEIMSVDPDSKPGDRVFSSAFPSRPDAVLNPKKKIWETVAIDLKVSADGKATYRDEELLVEGQTPLTAATLRQVPIK